MANNDLNDILANATLVLNSIAEGIYATNDLGIIIYSNPTAARILGYTVEELLGQSAHDLFRHSRSDGSHLSREECDHHHLLTTGKTLDVLDDVFWNKDGTPIPVEFTSTSIQQQGQIIGIVVAFKDITKRKMMESRLLHQNEILEMIAAGEPLQRILQFLVEMVEQQTQGFCSILLMDKESDVLRFTVGPQLPPEYIVSLNEVPLEPEACACSRAAYWKKPVFVSDLQTDKLWQSQRRLPFSQALTACWSVPILSTDQTVLGTAVIYFPKSKPPIPEELPLLEVYAHLAGIAMQRENAEQDIHYLAYHDSLTGLCNRRFFLSHAQGAIERAKSTATSVGVMLLDLDRFKSINDTLGHNFGDLVLKQVAKRLGERLSPTQTLARMGGDEFLILLDGIPSSDRLSEEARELMRGFDAPLLVDGREFHITASAGIAHFPQDGEDLDTLIRQADRAMYYAKKMGGNGFQLYLGMKDDQFTKNSVLEMDLQQALHEGRFYIDFQPKVHLKRGEVTGAEALIRWNHPDLGVISPGEFIPIAEETGLIRQLDDWVLNTVCQQITRWQARGFAPVPVAVNLSAMQFQQPDLVTSIQNLLAVHNVDASWLEIEITETTLMRNNEEAMKKLKQLRQMGVCVSIDDFGVGYSCLALLQHLSVDALKVDQAFIRDMSPKNAAILSTIIQLGHNLNLKVVAEGVETMEQQDFIAENGCDEMQGFLFSRPVSPNQFEQFLLQVAPSSSRVV